MKDNRILQVLQGREGNYLYPFFWQHGQKKEVLEHYMEIIREMGIRAVCIESRPHPDFLGEGWWRDLDIILAQAKRLGMKVWILDDSHFPTGFANGRVQNAGNSVKRWHLLHREMDITGPVHHGRIAVNPKNGYGILEEGEELVSLSLVKRISEDNFSSDGDFIDITDQIRDGWLRIDIPWGRYRIYFVLKKLQGAKEFNDYIDMTNPESVDLLIEEVYEKHYSHYKEQFGEVITGFFSDEPGFYNYSKKNGFSFQMQIGSDMPIPWNEEIADKMKNTLLPALWFPCGPDTEIIRAQYMDALTKLYQKNFTERLAAWCHSRGVEYVGHIIEDNNCHARLGPSCGHYFRALTGQDMSGIDVVLQQILPQMDSLQYGMSARGPQDGSFNFYGLAKLASSMAHLDKKTKGRAMCEIFGAYGWMEGIGLMKWLADHMLVRGINMFVPHAFSEKNFPDEDCPPHFYAHGKNPQHRYMKTLFTYINRMCHLLTGGKSAADTAVLYHAECEWLGRSMYFHTVGKELLCHQIDYDVLPLDYFENADIEEGKIKIGESVFRQLLIPCAEYYPDRLKQIVKKCSKCGVRVIQVMGKLPEDSRTGKLWDWEKNAAGEILEGAKQIQLECVSEFVSCYQNNNFTFLPKKGAHKWLRKYHYIHRDGTDIFLLFNESTVTSLQGNIYVPGEKGIFRYDALQNRIYQCKIEKNRMAEVNLEPGEMAVFISGELPYENILQEKVFKEENVSWEIFSGKTEVFLADYREQDDFKFFRTFEDGKWPEISETLPDFAGIIRYEMEICIPKCRQMKRLAIENAREGVQLWVNGEAVGICLGNPYSYDIENMAATGKISVCIEIATTLVPALCDVFSRNAVLQPEGISGPLKYLLE